MGRYEPDSLFQNAAQGDQRARQELLMLYWDRLRRGVANRMGRDLARRVGPSEIINAALASAALQLDRYLAERPMPFFPWLEGFTRDELIAAYRKHVLAQCRSVRREVSQSPGANKDSACRLAELLVDDASSAATRLVRCERVQQLMNSLGRLRVKHQEILVLHYLEGLTLTVAAESLGIGENAARMRHLRALEEIRLLMNTSESGGDL